MSETLPNISSEALDQWVTSYVFPLVEKDIREQFPGIWVEDNEEAES